MGVAFLLAQLNLLGDMEAWHFWPLILVLAGILKLTRQDAMPGRVEGILFIAAGCLVQLHYLGVIHLQWKLLWPVLVIAFGFFMLWSTWYRGRKRRGGREKSASYVDGFVILGGKEDRVDTKDFKGGEVTCVLGGYDLDLRDAGLEEPEVVLSVRVIMGGVDIRVPDDWSVTVRGTPVMGAFEDKTRPARTDEAEGGKRLILEGTVVMGGVEVRN
jgi:predicted membrane protein